MTEANITWVTEQVATGGDLSLNPMKAERQFAELLCMDIDLIIDCRIEASDEEVWDGTGVDYLHLPVNDIYGQSLPAEHFDAAVLAARPVLARGGRVFVHCHMGINRGPSTAYAILLDQGFPARAGFDLIRAKRPVSAIYYAEDALRAHLKRRGVKGQRRQQYMKSLKGHIKQVFTQKEWDEVQHVIRAQHAQDSRDLVGA